MDKLFDSPWALRVTALILALLLFFYVKAQLDDNTKSAEASSQMAIITDVPLEVYYDTENLIVTGLPKTVDVTIEGPMQIVLKTKLTKDFKVFVDLNTLLIGEHRVTIQTENLSPKLDVSIDPKVVDIEIEEKVTEEVKVEPEFNKGLIAEGYELTGITAEPSTVFVTGPKSVIENIGYVKATIDNAKGITESFSKEANIRVLDNSLNKLDVIIEPEFVNVNVGVKPYSRKVPITIRQTGTPVDGVTINSITSQTKVVEVFGPKSIIDPITRLEVEFDLSEIAESGTYKVNIPLPNGATRLSKKTLEVQANITKATTQTQTQSGTNGEQGTKPEVTEQEEQTNNGEITPEVETPADEDNDTE
ncbi:MAG TPA: CdaR family protein [Ureibacillus sp.]|nr:CdaR family protein [Ureibacillus sp.]